MVIRAYVRNDFPANLSDVHSKPNHSRIVPRDWPWFCDGSNREIGTTFVTALLMSLVIWIPCLGCFIAWYFIKSRHNVGWGGALIAWILGGIIQILVMILLLIFVFGSIFAAIMAGLLPMFPYP